MIIFNCFTSHVGLYSVGPNSNGLGTTLAVRSIFTVQLENRGSHPDSGFGKRGEASICGATLGLRGNSLNQVSVLGLTCNTRRVVRLGKIESPTLNFWYHICLDIDTTKNTVDAAINGEVVGQGIDMGEGMGKERPDLLKGNMVVGKWNYIFTGEDEQFSGSVTNIAFFASSTNQEDLATLSENLCQAPEPLLRWKDIKWQVEGEVIELETSIAEVCDQATSYSLLITEPIGQEAAVATCSKLGHGRMVKTTTKEEARTLVSWVDTKGASCSSIWTPFSDHEVEGTFVSIENGEEPSDIAWRPGQPSGGSTENSLRIDTKSKQLEDAREVDGDCFVCKIKRSFTARLRGGCKETKLERLFYLENNEAVGIRYIGWRGSVITYRDRGVWEIRHYLNKTGIFGTISASSESLLLGRHQWNLVEDSYRYVKYASNNRPTHHSTGVQAITPQ